MVGKGTKLSCFQSCTLHSFGKTELGVHIDIQCMHARSNKDFEI